MRTKLRNKLARRSRVLTPRAMRPNQKWSMDFISAKLLDGRWFRVLTLIDQFTRECLALVADRALNGHGSRSRSRRWWPSAARRSRSPPTIAANSP